MQTTSRRTLPERIRTERLLLRRQRVADAPLLKEAIDASLAHLQASVGWARPAPFALEAVAQHLAESEAAFSAGDAWTYSIFDPDETSVLGAVAAEPAEPMLTALVGEGTVEMGYWLRASVTGQGYATEASGALVEAVVAHLAAARVAICHDPGNASSGGVPRRLGFRSLGVVTSAILPGRAAADGSMRPATQVWVLEPERAPA